VGTEDTRVQRAPDSQLGAFGKHGRYGRAKGVGSGCTGSASGRWPANLILSYPEDEYELRDDVTPEQLRQLAGWLDANR